MFKFLKEKLKNAISGIDKKIVEEGKDEEIEVEPQQPTEIKTVHKQEPKQESTSVLPSKPSQETKTEPEPEQKKGFFARLAGGFKKKVEEPLQSEFQENKRLELAEKDARALTKETPVVEKIETRKTPDKKSHDEKTHDLLEAQDGEVQDDIPQEDDGTLTEESKPTPAPSKEVTQQDEFGAREALQAEPKTPYTVPKHNVKPSSIKPVEPTFTPADTLEELGIKNIKSISKPATKHQTPHQTPVNDSDKHTPTLKPRPELQPSVEQPVARPSATLLAEIEPEQKKGFFSRMTERVLAKKISESQFDELFLDLEMSLLENNVAFEVVEKIKDDLKKQLVDIPIRRSRIEAVIVESLKNSIEGLFSAHGTEIEEAIQEKKEKPYVICFVGINGSGKTTTIAKFAHLLLSKEFSCIIAAADTFRAAAIDQLEHHGEKLGVRVVAHNYGSDPAAVVFDAVKHAQAKNIDVVLVDTAGRLNTNTNLMDELRKIIRIAKPDLKIFVGESITGNDCIEQAKEFDEAVGIDEIILSKADVDEKGGTAISIGYVTKKPISYLGVGQEYKDLQVFSHAKILEQLGLVG